MKETMKTSEPSTASTSLIFEVPTTTRQSSIYLAGAGRWAQRIVSSTGEYQDVILSMFRGDKGLFLYGQKTL